MLKFLTNTDKNTCLVMKQDLQNKSDIQLIQRLKNSTSDDYQHIIMKILKERGYTAIEIQQLIR